MFDELIAVLDQLQVLYQGLLAQADDEREALVHADLDGIRRLACEKQILAVRAEALEMTRRKVVAGLSAQLPGKPTTVAGLAAAAGFGQAEGLCRCAERLKATVEKLQAANRAGLDLIAHSLKVVQGTLRLIGVRSRPGIYARSGHTPGPRNGRILSAEG